MSKGLIINIMEQQQKLLFSFGRLDNRYERLTDPLLEEAAEEFVLQNSDRLIENDTNGSSEGPVKPVRFPPTEEDYVAHGSNLPISAVRTDQLPKITLIARDGQRPVRWTN